MFKNGVKSYDSRVMRIILTTAVVVSVPTLAGMICGVFFDDIVSTFCDVMMVTSVITFCPMVGLWLACLDAWLYLRELGKAGYEVPDDRRKYNCVLENLPREREDYCIVDGRDRDSVILACITAACTLCFAVVVIKYYVGWWRWIPGVSIPVSTVLVTVVFYYILMLLDTPNIVFSTISIVTSFLAAALTMLRSSYYAVGYAANDVILIVLWVLASLENPAYIPVVVNFVIFFANDMYGFVSWKKREVRQAVDL